MSTDDKIAWIARGFAGLVLGGTFIYSVSRIVSILTETYS